MATILEENRKHLRQALRVECGFRETADEPTSLTPIGNDSAFNGVENFERSNVTTPLMDLAGDGFANDGEAVPMYTDSSVYRYGVISEEATNSDGTFTTPFGLTLEAAEDWKYLTLEVMDQAGAVQVLMFEPVWIGGQATVYIDSWTPGERAYIVGVFLGKAWIWNNENLLSANLDLHSVNTEVGGELEVSSIELQAYETTDYTDLIGKIPTGAPIWYTAGYAGDMTRVRHFYLSESVSWENNVLKVSGQDATVQLEKELPTRIDSWGTDTTVDFTLLSRIEEALADISYEIVGHLPGYGEQYVVAQQVFVYVPEASRSVISEYTGVYRDEETFRVTYVDAGLPTLQYGNAARTWTIYADEISELVTISEQYINRVEMEIPDYYLQYNAEIEQIEATSGKTYFVDLDPPCNVGVTISPTPTSSTQINEDLFKFKAAASTTYTLDGYEALPDLTDENNPYIASIPATGVTKRLDFSLPICYGASPGESLTHDALWALLGRSNILYEFTFRGNPHIQPRDVLNVEVATWIDEDETIDGLFPSVSLYPSATLYPYGVYKKVRKMVKTWETMTVDTVTIEHSEGGGLSSKIIARRGVV